MGRSESTAVLTVGLGSFNRFTVEGTSSNSMKIRIVREFRNVASGEQIRRLNLTNNLLYTTICHYAGKYTCI